MREMEFKMERQSLVNIGDVVDVTEREGFNYSYIIEPAVAMSGCYKSRDRLKSMLLRNLTNRKSEKNKYSYTKTGL